MNWSSTTSYHENPSTGESSSSCTPSSAGLVITTPGNPAHQHSLGNDDHSPPLPGCSSILNSRPSFTSPGLGNVGTVTPSTLSSTIPPSSSSSPSSMLLPSPRSVSSSFKLAPTPSVCTTTGEEVEYPQSISLGEKDNSSMKGQGQGQGQGQGCLLSHEQEVQNDWKAILNESETTKQGQNSETSEEEVGTK